MFPELLSYQKNIWPAMVADLAKELGVSAESLVAIGLGWMPLEDCWVFPERDVQGDVVGLVRRFLNGKKLCVKGSKRGLTFAVSPDYQPNTEIYVPGSHNWTRVSEEFPCPICHKIDWCLVSVENPADPRAVLCGRKAEGATQSMGDAGFLHIRKEEGRLAAGSAPGILPESEFPVLVVEGQSDVCAGMDLGFVTVGKPSASGGLQLLAGLLVGRDVVVIGENDAGAGRQGMERTFETLRPKVSSVVKVMPPSTTKDLRTWVHQGLTTDALLQATESGTTESDENVLESIAPMDIAERWLQERHYFEELPLLRLYSGVWYRFNGIKYDRVDDKTYVRGDLYSFLKGKKYKKFTAKGEASIEPYDAEAYKISNIIDTLTMTCPVYGDAPFWLTDEDAPQPVDTISFSNGLLVLPDLELRPPTPEFFSLTAAPYDWRPEAAYPRWRQFLREIFPGDVERVALLQEWFGYNMVADTSQEKLMFFVGRPGAGKGTVIDALRAMLGGPQVASTSFDNLINDFGLQPLLGKLAAIMPDAHITRRGDPSKALQILKEISGRDSVSVNRKHKEFLADHKLTCRFTISVNSMPDLPDHERSLDRRLLLLPFDECFTGKEDTTLKDTLVGEAPGIAVWAIEGLLRLRQQGFTLPVTARATMEDFRKQSSPITEFTEENCRFETDLSFPSMMIYEAYARWCKDQGMRAGTRTKFAQRFALLNPGCHRGRMSYNNAQLRCFYGVALTDAAIDRYLVGRT